MTAADYLRIFFRRKWYVLIPMTISLGIAVSFAWVLLVDLYQTSSRVEIIEHSVKSADPGSVPTVTPGDRLALLKEIMRSDDYLKVLVFYHGKLEEEIKDDQGKILKIRQIKKGFMPKAVFVKYGKDYSDKSIAAFKSEEECDAMLAMSNKDLSLYKEGAFYHDEIIQRRKVVKNPGTQAAQYFIETDKTVRRFVLRPDSQAYVGSKIRTLRGQLSIAYGGGDPNVFVITSQSPDKDQIHLVVDSAIRVLEAVYNRKKYKDADDGVNYVGQELENKNNEWVQTIKYLEEYKIQQAISILKNQEISITDAGRASSRIVETPYVKTAQELEEIKRKVAESDNKILLLAQDKKRAKHRVIQYYNIWSIRRAQEAAAGPTVESDPAPDREFKHRALYGVNLRQRYLLQKSEYEIILDSLKASGKSDLHPDVKDVLTKIAALDKRLEITQKKEEQLRSEEDKKKGKDFPKKKDVVVKDIPGIKNEEAIAKQATRISDYQMEVDYKELREDHNGNALMNQFWQKVELLKSEEDRKNIAISSLRSLMEEYSGLKYNEDSSDSQYEKNRKFQQWLAKAEKKGADRMNKSLSIYRAKQNQVKFLEAEVSRLKGRMIFASRLLEVTKQGQIRFRIIEPANAPVKPFYPKKYFIILVGLLIGGLISAGGIFLAEYADHSIRTEEDAERHLEFPVLGVIPEYTFQSREAWHKHIGWLLFWKKRKGVTSGKRASLTAVRKKQNVKMLLIALVIVLVAALAVGFKYLNFINYVRKWFPWLGV